MLPLSVCANSSRIKRPQIQTESGILFGVLEGLRPSGGASPLGLIEKRPRVPRSVWPWFGENPQLNRPEASFCDPLAREDLHLPSHRAARGGTAERRRKNFLDLELPHAPS